jgi:hypothetical protein
MSEVKSCYPSTFKHPTHPETLTHDCIQILDDSLTTFHHILDIPMLDDPTWFIDGSSTIASITTPVRAGYTIVRGIETVQYTQLQRQIAFSYNYLPTDRTICSYISITNGKRQDGLTFFTQIQSIPITSFIPTARTGRNEIFLIMKGSPIINAKYIVVLSQVAISHHKAAILYNKRHQKDNIFKSISHNLVTITIKQVAQETPLPKPLW